MILSSFPFAEFSGAFLFSVPFFFFYTKIRDIIPERNRTNESCKIYSDACLEVCRELDVKAVDLWTSIQKRKDWSTACFTYVQFHILVYAST